jgi:hypothetical protein
MIIWILVSLQQCHQFNRLLQMVNYPVILKFNPF